MKKVITFGTFDLIHPGHTYYLQEAKSYGNILITIIARDQNVKKIKGQLPVHDEEKRMQQIKDLDISDIVQLGSLHDPLEAIKQHKPDIVALGHDQNSFIHELSDFLYTTKMKTEVVTIDGLQPEIYKSSFLK